MTSHSTVDVAEVRVLEGPNLYFAKPAIKVSLELPGLPRGRRGDAAGTRAPHGPAGRAARVHPARSSASGSSCDWSSGPCVGWRRRAAPPASACAAGRAAPRSRWWSPSSGAGADAAKPSGGRWAPPWPRGWTAATPSHELAERDHRGTAPGANALRCSCRPIPVASVTGTNGKTTTTRLLGHIGMTAGLRDGVVLHRRHRRAGRDDRAGRLLRARPGPGRCSPRRGCSWASSRPPAAACCSRAWASPPTTSRWSPTSRPTTSGCRGSTPSTSSPRSRRSSPGPPSPVAGRCSTAMTPGCGPCEPAPEPGRGCSPCAQTPRRFASPWTPAAAPSPSWTATSRCWGPGRDPDRLVSVLDVPGDAVGPLGAQHRQRPRRPPPRPSAWACPGTPSSRDCARSRPTTGSTRAG